MFKHSVIILCGATGIGKTAVGLQLAELLQTEIISADSRQCFKELNVGVAKPSREELDKIHHYFINTHHIHDEVNAAIFEQYALDVADKIFRKQLKAIMVGGTGLYIKAFVDGMDEIPAVEPQIRKEVLLHFQKHGLIYLQQQLSEKDPAYWKMGEKENPQRLMRALEVVLSSGKSITSFYTKSKENRPFNIIKIGLELPRQQINERINLRVDEMIRNGLVEEAYSLLPYRSINALQTVGYRELFEYFDGKVTLLQAINNIKTNTRHYAKRQMTWFRKDKEVHWLSASSEKLTSAILEKIPGND